MAFFLKNIFPNVSRHSNASRSAAEMGNADVVSSMSMALSSAAIATGTTTSKVKTVASLSYIIGGVFQTAKGATDDFWTLSGTTVAASRFQKYALLIDTTGAASIQEATQATTAAGVVWTNVANQSAWAPIISLLSPGTKAIVGVLQVATDATHTFIPGTTLLGATGITATYVNGIDPSLLPIIANQQGTVVGLGG